VVKKKCPEVLTLPSYKETPPARFWAKFQSQPLPTVPYTPVNIPVLQQLLHKHSAEFSLSQRLRGEKVVSELTKGVDPLQAVPLPGEIIANSGSVLEHAEIFTDVLANWITKDLFLAPLPHPLVRISMQIL
jgi:hypothetical protein